MDAHTRKIWKYYYYAQRRLWEIRDCIVICAEFWVFCCVYVYRGIQNCCGDIICGVIVSQVLHTYTPKAGRQCSREQGSPSPLWPLLPPPPQVQSKTSPLSLLLFPPRQRLSAPTGRMRRGGGGEKRTFVKGERKEKGGKTHSKGASEVRDWTNAASKIVRSRTIFNECGRRKTMLSKLVKFPLGVGWGDRQN